MDKVDEEVRIWSPSKGWLDGFDGTNYEWIDDQNQAWIMKESEAKRRLELMKDQVSDARIFPKLKRTVPGDRRFSGPPTSVTGGY